MSRFFRFLLIGTLVAIAWLVPSQVGAVGATLIVNGSGDEDPTNGLCDLEEAIKAAVLNADYADCQGIGPYGDDEIQITGTVSLSHPLLVNGGGALTLRGPATIDWQGPNTARLLTVDGSAGWLTVQLKELELIGNDRPGLHVGQAQLIIEDSVLRGFATGARGAAVRAQPAADVEIRRSILRENRSGVGGAISLFPVDPFPAGRLLIEDSWLADNLGAFSGGGVRSLRGSVSIVRSTFSGNQSARGGAIDVDGGQLSMVNSTLSGNRAPVGSALRFGQASTGQLSFVTLADQQSGTALLVTEGSVVQIHNVVLADPDVDECTLAGGTVTLSGATIADDSTCGQLLVEPSLRSSLGPLAANGGSTPTHALLNGSPAIDAVLLGACTDTDGNLITTDQRGSVRPSPPGGQCDSGAFELYQELPTPTPTPTPTPSPTPTPTPTPSPTPTATPTPSPTATPTPPLATPVGTPEATPPAVPSPSPTLSPPVMTTPVGQAETPVPTLPAVPAEPASSSPTAEHSVPSPTPAITPSIQGVGETLPSAAAGYRQVLPKTGGPSTWVTALMLLGILLVIFGVALSRRPGPRSTPSSKGQ